MTNLPQPEDQRRLSDLTTLRVGGLIAQEVVARSEEELVAAVVAADDAGRVLLVLGGGSNILAADEPFAGVDPIAVEDIQGIVAKLKEKNIGILITDHYVQETLSITDRAYLLFEGKILKQGTASQLADDEQVRTVYLGKNFELRR